MHWQTKVFTNDPVTPVAMVSVQGFLKTPVVFWPSIVFLKGPKKQPVTQSVRVEGKLDRELKLEAKGFDLAKHVSYEIIEVQAGKTYQINFTSIPGELTNYRGSLKLKTSYDEKPEIVIPVWANFEY